MFFLIPDAADLSQCFEGVDTVVHLAALKSVNESMQFPQKYSKNNIAGTLALLDAMHENNVKHIIFSSTAAVYGEPEYLPLDEKHPLKPINFYGYTKLSAENLLEWYKKLVGVNQLKKQ